MNAKVFLLMVLLVVVACGEQQRHSNPQPLEDRKEAARFLAFFTSTSATRLATTTVTALSTCFSFSAGAPICNGRRRRGILKGAQDLGDFEMIEGEVESSLSTKINEAPKSKPVRKERKLTIWSTSYSTLTLTSTSFLQGTTVSVSVLCVIGNAANSCVG